MTTPEEVIQAAMDRGLTLACAESLTGGALCTALVSVPGSSEVVLGGIVTYTVGVKEDVLGVDPAIIEAHGVVSRETAIAMAKRVREMFGAEVGAATTGAAGPEPHGGKPGWDGVCGQRRAEWGSGLGAAPRRAARGRAARRGRRRARGLCACCGRNRVNNCSKNGTTVR